MSAVEVNFCSIYMLMHLFARIGEPVCKQNIMFIKVSGTWN